MHDPPSAKLEALTTCTELHCAYTGVSGPIIPS